jgi:hypothetical protein
MLQVAGWFAEFVKIRGHEQVRFADCLTLAVGGPKMSGDCPG